MHAKHHVIEVILENFTKYGAKAKEYFAKEETDVDRKKHFVGGSVYSHHDEVDKRLCFMKYFAQQSEDYCMS